MHDMPGITFVMLVQVGGPTENFLPVNGSRIRGSHLAREHILQYRTSLTDELPRSLIIVFT